MKLSQRTVGVIITLMVMALAGLVALQSSLLKNAMDQKAQAFRRNVQAALGQVANRVATQEAFRWATRARPTSRHDTGVAHSYSYRFESGEAAWVGEDVSADVFIVGSEPRRDQVQEPRFRISDSLVVFSVPTAQHVMLQVFDPTRGRVDTLLDTIKSAGQHMVPYDASQWQSGHHVWKLITDSAHLIIESKSDESIPGEPAFTTTFDGFSTADSGRQVLVQAVLNRMAITEIEPLQARLDSLVLDSLIARCLEENGIDLAHAFGVTAYGEDTLSLVHPAVYREQLVDSPFRASLFPHDIFDQRTNLVLYFPDHREYLWGEIAPMLAASVILTLIIVGCFAYTIRTIFAQRRFSGRLVEFINNMTHEFKTPISTVALATEAIERPDVAGDPEKVQRFNEMIQSENRRMRVQVDKILQMAVLEEGDYELDMQPVDLHDIIRQAVSGFALKLESRGGRLETSLQASRSMVTGDAVHLLNIISNVLDNAHKYTPETPRISVSTRDDNHGIAVVISDNGIGITEDDRSQVFDKYFRVPSGNVHDVKGFGIGLSYVKLMVKAHGGRIALDSEPGRGTTVQLHFPAEPAKRND